MVANLEGMRVPCMAQGEHPKLAILSPYPSFVHCTADCPQNRDVNNRKELTVVGVGNNLRVTACQDED